MDFHKLQQTLNDIEPSDRAQDIEKLRRAAQGNNSPEPRQSVKESAVTTSSTRELNEAEQFAALAGITPSKSSKPVNSEADEIAALAGIRLDEKQKTGRAGQARGSDPWPETSKPSKDGEQPHPLKDKLVGDSYEDDDENVEEGPVWDQVKKQAKQGWKSPTNLGALKGVTDVPGAKGKGSKKAPGAAKETVGLPAGVSKALAPYATALSNILRNPEYKKEFLELMKAADPKLQLEAYRESRARGGDKDSIKEELMRRLNSKK